YASTSACGTALAPMTSGPSGCPARGSREQAARTSAATITIRVLNTAPPGCAWGGSVRRRRRGDGHALAATAGVGFVRIAEDEARGQPRLLPVDLRADQEQHRLGVDQDGHALVL